MREVADEGGIVVCPPVRDHAVIQTGIVIASLRSQ
jgi:hypothetical protein